MHLLCLPHAALVLNEQMGLGGEHGVADGAENEAKEHGLDHGVREDSHIDVFSLHFVFVDLVVQAVLGAEEQEGLGECV